jgi:hypothetical protein
LSSLDLAEFARGEINSDKTGHQSRLPSPTGLPK